MDPIMQGVSLSLAGLLMAFLSMGLLIFVIIGLQKIFPHFSDESEFTSEETIVVPLEPVVAAVAVEAIEEEQVAAAIAVAISRFQSRNQEGLGDALKQGHGPWWYSDRGYTLARKY